MKFVIKSLKTRKRTNFLTEKQIYYMPKSDTFMLKVASEENIIYNTFWQHRYLPHENTALLFLIPWR